MVHRRASVLLDLLLQEVPLLAYRLVAVFLHQGLGKVEAWAATRLIVQALFLRSDFTTAQIPVLVTHLHIECAMRDWRLPWRLIAIYLIGNLAGDTPDERTQRTVPTHLVRKELHPSGGCRQSARCVQFRVVKCEQLQNIAHSVHVPESRIYRVHQRKPCCHRTYRFPLLHRILLRKSSVGRYRKRILHLIRRLLLVVDPVGEVDELAVRLKTVHPELPPEVVGRWLDAVRLEDGAEGVLPEGFTLRIDRVYQTTILCNLHWHRGGSVVV